jgi:hypothetical protein
VSQSEQQAGELERVLLGFDRAATRLGAPSYSDAQVASAICLIESHPGVRGRCLCDAFPPKPVSSDARLEQVPRPRDALEPIVAAIGELGARTGHEGRNHPGHHDLTGSCGVHDPSGEVNGDAPYVGAAALDLAHVYPRADLDAGACQPVPQRRSAPQRVSGPVEGDEQLSFCPVRAELSSAARATVSRHDGPV